MFYICFGLIFGFLFYLFFRLLGEWNICCFNSAVIIQLILWRKRISPFRFWNDPIDSYPRRDLTFDKIADDEQFLVPSQSKVKLLQAPSEALNSTCNSEKQIFVSEYDNRSNEPTTLQSCRITRQRNVFSLLYHK